jgi:hypothetical protein
MNPKTKVFFHGKQIYPKRDGQGKFSSFKTKLGKFLRTVTLVILTLGVLTSVGIGLYKMGGKNNPRIVTQEIEIDNSPLMYSQRVDTLKSAVVTKLAICESGNTKDSDGLIIFDTNKKASIGRYQFQVATVQHYYKILYQKTITSKEAIEIAIDADLAGSLAKDIMFKSKNKADDWYNCSVKLGLNKEIDIINKL